LFGKLSCEKARKTNIFCLRICKIRQHLHKGKPRTQEKSQDAATSTEDAIKDSIHVVVELRPHVYVTEEPAEFHGKEAVGYHQEGGESHKVLASGLYT
jgi:hypothetical protein